MYYKFDLRGLKRNIQLIAFNFNWKKQFSLVAINMHQSV